MAPPSDHLYQAYRVASAPACVEVVAIVWTLSYMNMGKELVPKRDMDLVAGGAAGVPAVVLAAGEKAGLRFLEFFTANIRNTNTRRAYHRACAEFFRWCGSRGLPLERIGPVHVAAYIEKLGKDLSRPTVKQQLAAIRMLFDWLVRGQVVPVNPAHSVRGPRHSVKKGTTPVLTADEARVLLASIAVEREDEKGGKRHEMPAHHNLEEYMAAYIEAAGIAGKKGTPLFRTAKGKTQQLTERGITQPEVYLMIRRRAGGAGIKTLIGCHTFRATGITGI